jgi:hypothetical protein
MHHQTTSQSCATTQTTIFVDDLYSLTHSIEKYFGEVSINNTYLYLYSVQVVQVAQVVQVSS